MPLWLIEARRARWGEWELVSVEFDQDMARAVQDELVADGVTHVRVFERHDTPQHAEALLASADRLSAQQLDRWRRHRERAIARVHRQGNAGP
jgi:hypothetical protein